MPSNPDHPDHPDHADHEGTRRIDPITGTLFGRKRQAVQRRCAALADEIAELDRQLLELAHQRRTKANALKDERRRLWPKLYLRGRQPGPDGAIQLPPLPTDAEPLWGRRLRSACRAILARLGRATLTELHAALHHLGYRIAGNHPVKTLADALGYDTDRGLVDRPRRGTYAHPGTLPRPTRLWPGGPPIGHITPNNTNTTP